MELIDNKRVKVFRVIKKPPAEKIKYLLLSHKLYQYYLLNTYNILLNPYHKRESVIAFSKFGNSWLCGTLKYLALASTALS